MEATKVVTATMEQHTLKIVNNRPRHPLDGVTNPKYKLLHLFTTIIFYKEKKALAFNRDRCCHLPHCLWLILFHGLNTNIYSYLEITGGQSLNPHLNVVHFFNTSINLTSVPA